MSNDTGAIARQRHFTTLRNADREVLRETWSIGYGDPGFTTQFGAPPEPSHQHTATSISKLIADARWLHRGACLACPWEGPDRQRRDPAIEDAHDHTHPEWRNLPIFDRARSGKGAKVWRLHVMAMYPRGWFEAGGPLRLYAEPPFDRHEAGAAPGGGYILHTARRKPQPLRALQLTLE
ncbi:hypothetical protein SAMN05428942_2110 [Streptomyces sp. 2112.2]|uniref:DUF6349 family protein n=1 Tax=Streptomyces sp. 2112.2 TaxID=1881024 RepID=UPI0008961B94|nr:DUF6349 family protein [Streptomyces sp. 2112.2]SED60124.1 hypothetical protein SAMN05428942_2110 [Streptomyces sp. 2112.2]